jgi:hypothetical protein
MLTRSLVPVVLVLLGMGALACGGDSIETETLVFRTYDLADAVCSGEIIMIVRDALPSPPDDSLETVVFGCEPPADDAQ